MNILKPRSLINKLWSFIEFFRFFQSSVASLYPVVANWEILGDGIIMLIMKDFWITAQ